MILVFYCVDTFLNVVIFGTMSTQDTLTPIYEWFEKQEWKPFPFQIETWNAYLDGWNGIVNAPTGSGKTYAMFMPIVAEALAGPKNQSKELKAIWVTPIRALAKEIYGATSRAIAALDLKWKVGIRTGDTTTKERQDQLKNPPQLLITTPESIHVLMCSKDRSKIFSALEVVVVDEWHELMGSKRGVQIELALSKFKVMNTQLKIWGISATIGNMDEALSVLLGLDYLKKPHKIIRSNIKKKIEVLSVLPDEIEKFPWAGHLGIRMLEKVMPIIHESESVLIFTNTRSQCEIWYQRILSIAPDLAGIIAMHHGSIGRKIRSWVEEALHDGRLKVVVCTSSLDLGVDFRPVDTIIQIGSPKGVARFVQRAGRSGHRPGALSKIYFVPTHSLELVESAALREAIQQSWIENRTPFIRSFDVLIQYLMTLAVSDGFFPAEIYKEIKTTFCYESISEEEFAWTLDFLVNGGALTAYDEFKKIEIDSNGKYLVVDRYVRRQHLLSIGTIVSDVSMQVKYLSGRKIGSVEEWFIAQLKPGDVFWFAGRSLELVRIKGLSAYVRKSNKKTGKVPSWQGGRMSLSSELSEALRLKLNEGSDDVSNAEIEAIRPLLDMQRDRSHLPNKDEFLVEYFQSEDGHHILMYPFEGRLIHEGMATIIAYRLAKLQPLSFSIAMNDYGFELLTDVSLSEEILTDDSLYETTTLKAHIEESVNMIEMSRRRFRDIAAISGLIFKGYPGKEKKERHLQTSSGLLFDVFHEYDPDNLLYLQSFDEALYFQLDEYRLKKAFERISEQRIVVKKPEKATPFSFPIMVDRLRDKLTSEKLKDRISKMHLALK